MTFRNALRTALIALTIISSPAGNVFNTSATDAEASGPTGATREPLATLPGALLALGLSHVETVAAELEPSWSNATLGDVRAVERPGIKGVAYYDVEVVADGEAAGYMLLTNGVHDHPVVRFSTVGESPTDELARRAIAQGRRPARFVKVDVYLGAERPGGRLIASTLDEPNARRRWRELKPLAREIAIADAQAAIGLQPQPQAGYPGKSCSTGGMMSPAYKQLKAGEYPNPSSYCASGCGPTAWAILIAWIDRQAAEGDSGWVDYRGLVRQGGVASTSRADGRAPLEFDWPAKQMSADIRNDLGSICWPSPGTSSTDIYQMGRIGNYLARVGMYGPLEPWTYHIGGAPSGWVGDRVESMICDLRTPAVVGIGDSSHYVVAHGTWRDSGNNLWIWANFGWGRGTVNYNGRTVDSYGMWSLEKTFFAGTLVKKYKPAFPANPSGLEVLSAVSNMWWGQWDFSSSVANVCTGKPTCTFTANPNLYWDWRANYINVRYQCGTDTVRTASGWDNQPLTLTCPTIQVIDATYGGNCGAPRGNKTSTMAFVCNYRTMCSYQVDYRIIGDPVPGCGKDYVVNYRCSDTPWTTRTAYIAPEAGFQKTVVLRCS